MEIQCHSQSVITRFEGKETQMFEGNETSGKHFNNPRSRASTTAVFKDSVCSSTSSTHAFPSSLLKIRDSHITSSFSQRPTPTAGTWLFTPAQSNFGCSSLSQKAEIRPSLARTSKMRLAIRCSCSGHKFIVVFSASRSLGERSVADAMATPGITM